MGKSVVRLLVTAGFILTMRNVNDVNKRIKIKPRKVLY